MIISMLQFIDKVLRPPIVTHDYFFVEYLDADMLYSISVIEDKYIGMTVYEGRNNTIELVIFVKINEYTDMKNIFINPETYCFEYSDLAYDLCNVWDRFRLRLMLWDDLFITKEIWF